MYNIAHSQKKFQTRPKNAWRLLYFYNFMLMLPLQEYTYTLPPERIALHPLPDRDQSRLLVYQKGKIAHHAFTDLPQLLGSDCSLFFNNTQVIPARLLFKKETGAAIEVFLLHPKSPTTLVQQAMLAQGECTWQCTLGNSKRWPEDVALVYSQGELRLKAQLTDRAQGLVTFSWQPAHLSFAEVIQTMGQVPLPPYLHRAAVQEDRQRYQTVYAQQPGAVAAPTAGLHFTDRVLQQIRSRGIAQNFLTLHVSAGTFQPIKTDDAAGHTMHGEQMVVTRQNIQQVLDSAIIVAVGTTAMRTLESLYWYGVKLLLLNDSVFHIAQDLPYALAPSELPTRDQAFAAIANYMDKSRLESLTGETHIYIRPGYTFRVVRGLITNFHQPGSSLILLVAAFVGPDWRKIYAEALAHPYRFLSYGDSSLLIP